MIKDKYGDIKDQQLPKLVKRFHLRKQLSDAVEERDASREELKKVEAEREVALRAKDAEARAATAELAERTRQLDAIHAAIGLAEVPKILLKFRQIFETSFLTFFDFLDKF